MLNLITNEIELIRHIQNFCNHLPVKCNHMQYLVVYVIHRCYAIQLFLQLQDLNNKTLNTLMAFLYISQYSSTKLELLRLKLFVNATYDILYSKMLKFFLPFKYLKNDRHLLLMSNPQSITNI